MTDGSDDARRAKVQAMADAMMAGYPTVVAGREQEYLLSMVNVLKTFHHNQGYAHEINDALVKSWLLGIRFARKHDLLEDYIAESIDVLKPVLMRVRGLIEETGERELALEAIAGLSTDHSQLVITETHKDAGKRWFLSPFGRVLDACQKMGIFDFDETYVVEEFFLPRARGFGDLMGVSIATTWDAGSRIITVGLAD